jgi:hypothetical protein
MTTMTPTTTALTPTRARLVQDRVLASKGATRGSLTTLHLEDVRDHVRSLAQKQEPLDHERSFSQMHVAFTGGRVTARLLNAQGADDEMLVSKNAFSQMASELLPARFGGGLMDLAALDGDGEKLATMAWAKFARLDDKPRLFRTVLMKDPTDGSVKRMLRSQHSQGYGTYDNVRFVEDLLANASELRDLPVAQFHLGDAGMRLRFLGVAKDEVTLRTPVPMIEAWNSEVGRRRVGLIGGMWKLVCTNGMGTWDKKSEFHWRHYGEGDRIGRGVASAMDEIGTASSRVLEAYDKALHTGIDDAFAWMEAQMRGTASTPFIARAIAALDHPTTTPGKTLASVIDAITLEAQEEDMFTQADMEALAADVLRRGLSQARNERILVEA